MYSVVIINLMTSSEVVDLSSLTKCDAKPMWRHPGNDYVRVAAICVATVDRFLFGCTQPVVQLA